MQPRDLDADGARAQGLSSARATFDNTKLALLIPLDLDKFQENYTAYPKVHSIKAMYFSIFLLSYLLAEYHSSTTISTLSSAKSIFY